MQIVQPQIVRLPLADGQWVDVKARLNHGEHTALYQRLYVETPDGDLRRDPMAWADSLIAAYLIDWSALDLPIRGASVADVLSALKVIDHDDFVEIKDAVEAHVNAIAAERAEKKRARIGGGASLPISASPAAAAGAMNG